MEILLLADYQVLVRKGRLVEKDGGGWLEKYSLDAIINPPSIYGRKEIK